MHRSILMREKVMMIMAIIVFASVPMVQLVAGDSAVTTVEQDSSAAKLYSLNAGLNLDALKQRFNISNIRPLPRLPNTWIGQNSDKNLPDWSQLENRTKFTPNVLPDSQIPVFPTPSPTPTSDPGTIQSTVYLSSLDIIGESLKIINSGNEKVVMTGWKISNQEGRSFTFIEYPLDNGSFFTYTLKPHSTVTIHTGMEGNPSSLHLYWPEEMWNNSGDTAYLYNPEGVLVSSLTR